MIFALLLVLGLTAFDLYRPMLVGDAIDTFGANGDYDVIIATAIKYAVVLALSFAFNIAQTWILQKTGQNIILQMRKDLYRHIQSLGSRYFDITPVGKLVTRVTNDVDTLGQSLNQSATQMITSVTTLIGVFIMMLSISPLMTVIAVLILPLSAGLIGFVMKHSQKYFVG